MSCYSPILLVQDVNPDTGEYSSRWTGLKYDPDSNVLNSNQTGVPVPCGSCVGCRLDASRRWADRCMLELDHSKKGVFLTLTYDDLHLPLGSKELPTLRYKDLQDFFKRLKERVRNIYPDIDIRRYAAGEYGDTTNRPHYHAIVFGLGLDFFTDLVPRGFNEFNQPLYSSQWLENVWSNGMCRIANVSWQTCAYVARYTAKKHIGRDSFIYSELGIEPEKALMSRRPGIGGYFFEDHPDLVSSDEYLNSLPISDPFGAKSVKSVNLPNYLIKKLDNLNPDLYNLIVNQRKEFAKDAMLNKLLLTDLSYVEFLNREKRLKSGSNSALLKTKI